MPDERHTPLASNGPSSSNPYRSSRAVGEPPDWQSPAAAKNSGLGVAALVVALVAVLLGIACIATGAYLDYSTPGGIDAIDDDAPSILALGLVALGIFGLNAFGLGLGVGGLVQVGSKKTAAILVVVIHALILFGGGGLMVVAIILDL